MKVLTTVLVLIATQFAHAKMNCVVEVENEQTPAVRELMYSAIEDTQFIVVNQYKTKATKVSVDDIVARIKAPESKNETIFILNQTKESGFIGVVEFSKGRSLEKMAILSSSAGSVQNSLLQFKYGQILIQCQ